MPPRMTCVGVGLVSHRPNHLIGADDAKWHCRHTICGASQVMKRVWMSHGTDLNIALSQPQRYNLDQNIQIQWKQFHRLTDHGPGQTADLQIMI